MKVAAVDVIVAEGRRCGLAGGEDSDSRRRGGSGRGRRGIRLRLQFFGGGNEGNDRGVGYGGCNGRGSKVQALRQERRKRRLRQWQQWVEKPQEAEEIGGEGSGGMPW
ncbi:hypothetical protein BHM03_00027275 [Ensete ventricosum]|nr:hypothetical protein BHM03_00027275 [Ensete ventricosum]